ncbi:MAG TPA: pyridoxamine 5'-phosphate oxidase family protein [Acidimicrobiales bacterium]|nr:pyridoxamine 5'-phosphate oxidase family protein [Acidimicrobiales bacterium]
MTTWNEFAAAEPDLSGRVRALFSAHKHHTMATLRKDGSPRISGTEVDFAEDGLALGMMAGARRAGDLRRDPRVALHSSTVDPDEDPTLWPGDAKVSGTASEVGEHQSHPGSHRFLVDLDHVVITRVGTPADHLVIETWSPDHGVRRIERR